MNNQNDQPIDPKQLSIFTVKQQYRGLTSELFEVHTSSSNSISNVSAISSLSAKDYAAPSFAQKLPFSEIVRCACFPFSAGARQVMAIITSNAHLLVQYEWILRKMSLSYSVEQVAASSDEQVFERETDAFTLQIKTDKSNSKQVYLLLSIKHLELAKETALNGLFIHCLMGRDFHVISFNNICDGQAQIMIEKESTAYKLLSNPNAKLYLC